MAGKSTADELLTEQEDTWWTLSEINPRQLVTGSRHVACEVGAEEAAVFVCLEVERMAVTRPQRGARVTARIMFAIV